MTTTTELPTEGEYTDAINTLEAVYGSDARELVEMLEDVRNDIILHDARSFPETECLEDCKGCLTERIADAVTRAVNGKAA